MYDNTHWEALCTPGPGLVSRNQFEMLTMLCVPVRDKICLKYLLQVSHQIATSCVWISVLQSEGVLLLLSGQLIDCIDTDLTRQE